MSNAKEDAVFDFIVANGFPVPERQYKAIPNRKYQVDFCWPDSKYRLVLEVEGGVWVGGRHNSPAGFLKDIEKYNLLSASGWTLYRVTPQDIGGDTPYLLDVLNMMFPEFAGGRRVGQDGA